jgi:hypothetical protein
MLKTLTREITLSIQAKNGASVAVVVWIGVIAFALLTAFVFICVAGYDWLSVSYGSITAGLIMAGIFVVIAVIAAIVSALVRRQVRQRAILARAEKAHAPPWFLDPRIVGVAVEAGRTIGWQRIIPVALVGLVAAQWARESRDRGQQHF